MKHFKNFKTCVYCTAQTLASLDETTLARDYAYLEKYVGIDKVYLETYRDGTWVAIDHMKMIQNFFKKHGVEIAGGITTVTPPLEKDDVKRQLLFQTFCYSNEAMRTYLKKIVTYTAELFDEIILDDFFFTSCTCDDCLRERSNLSWAEFRSKKMIDVAENLIHIYFDRFTSKEVFYRYRFHLTERYITIYQLISTGKTSQLTLRLFADIQDISLLFCMCRRNRKKNLINVVFLDIFQNVLASAYDRDIFHDSAPFVWVVIYDTAWSCC